MLLGPPITAFVRSGLESLKRCRADPNISQALAMMIGQR